MRHIFISFLILVLVGAPQGFVIGAEVFYPNDPEVRNQWYIEQLRLPEVWGKAQGAGVVIAVLDSGVDIDHPDLKNNIWRNVDELEGDFIDNDSNGYADDMHGWNFVEGNNKVNHEVSKDCVESGVCSGLALDHGTFISGIIAGEQNNAIAISGIAPKAKIMPLRVLNIMGQGDSGDIVDAIIYAVDNGAHIINMSFVGFTEDQILTQAIEYAFKRDVMVVVAGGNAEDGVTGVDLTVDPRHPVCSDQTSGIDFLMGVGAYNKQVRFSVFSNKGACIDISAPGEDLMGLAVHDPAIGRLSYTTSGFSGTSLATPMVSGTLALMKGLYPQATPTELFQVLKHTAVSMDGNNSTMIGMMGAGALNVVDAVQMMMPVPEGRKGRLVRTLDSTAVYYVALDGKRYVFPDSKTYYSWYPNFRNVEIVSAEQLAGFAIGGLINHRPGVNLVKITTLPNVYAVGQGGTLRWITSEAVAETLFGRGWQSRVMDVSDAFFTNYTYGEDITSPAEYSSEFEMLKTKTINDDIGL